jgi:RimJ/RimL family protein N-acetyltransferase
MMKQNSFLVSLRLLQREDFVCLLKWLNAPHVMRFWDGKKGIDQIIAKYEPLLEDNSPTRVYIIEANNIPIGFIQCYRHADHPEWEHLIGIDKAAGIDYLIGDVNYIGRGIGPQAIALMTKTIFDIYPEIDVVVSDPQLTNKQSWRALEKVGFERFDERKLESDADVSCIYVYKKHK